MKNCLFCGNELIKKHYESTRDFNRRLYCDKECFYQHRFQKTKENLIGLRFGKLQIYDFICKDGEYYVCVSCDCGNKKEYKYKGFQVSKPTHCGCEHGCKTHGMSNTPLYKSWSAMKRRCDTPDELHKKYYKDKGITYCEEWAVFENFRDWAIESGYVDKYTIERIDNSKGYFPENCKWISAKEQNNNKATTHFVEIDGETKPIYQWCKEYGIKWTTFYARLKKGKTGKQLVERV